MPTNFLNKDLPAANHIRLYIYKNILERFVLTSWLIGAFDL